MWCGPMRWRRFTAHRWWWQARLSCRCHGNAGSPAPGGRADRVPAVIIKLDRGASAQAGGLRPVSIEHDSDEVLMLAVAERRQQAFRVLMARHMPRAIRLAQRIVRDPAEADDIGQEAFLRVWNKASSFDPKIARFSTWLYRIVLNLSFDRTRKPRHAPIEDAAEVPSADPAPVEALITAQQQRLLEAALAELPERQRGAIALFHMEGLSGEEAARAMNLSPKAFESLLGRARLTLKKAVEKRQDDRRRA
ncbi:RNA polymerase sigma factor [Rhodopseudomonas palustris]|nr:RNA polymerase subunit sigma [Rhodopseudomonas palustris]RJF67284.1 RNA polymerase sigma factor [Rhodopseudomonas palustris]